MKKPIENLTKNGKICKWYVSSEYNSEYGHSAVLLRMWRKCGLNLKCFSYISGGQSRRVSFGISMLHDPKFIILDEPTVGIDPLLRQK